MESISCKMLLPIVPPHIVRKAAAVWARRLSSDLRNKLAVLSRFMLSVKNSASLRDAIRIRLLVDGMV